MFLIVKDIAFEIMLLFDSVGYIGAFPVVLTTT